jgi:hypothetical protein
MRAFHIAFMVLFGLTAVVQTSTAANIGFNGQLGFIEVDSGSGVYSGVLLGTNFFGEIDDVSFNGFISDGSTPTPFGCCIAAGGLEITDNEVLDAGGAIFLNSLLGNAQYSAGDVVDIVNIEGDELTVGGGRIEVGLSYVLDPNAFASEDPSNYPFNPSDLDVALFFILEENAGGTDIYSAGGLVSAVPLPAAVWLLGSGLITLLSLPKIRRRALTS